MKLKDYKKRADEIFSLREKGFTYLEIGNKYGLCTERIRCIIIKRMRHIYNTSVSLPEIFIEKEIEQIDEYTTCTEKCTFKEIGFHHGKGPCIKILLKKERFNEIYC